MGIPRIWFPNPPTGGLDASDRTLMGLGFPVPTTGPGIPSTYAFARNPVGVVVLELDYCGNQFGVAPCTASGVPCFNTYPTCKDAVNFRNIGRKYKYSSSGAGLPFIGPRPYLKSVRPLPTEIKTSLTVNSRLTAEMNDEPDLDLETDPYYMNRPELFRTETVTGTGSGLWSDGRAGVGRYFSPYDFPEMGYNLTIEAWVWATPGLPPMPQYSWAFGLSVSAYPSSYYAGVGFLRSSYVQDRYFPIFYGQSAVSPSSIWFEAGRWTHIVATSAVPGDTPGDGIKIYMNGNLVRQYNLGYHTPFLGIPTRARVFASPTSTGEFDRMYGKVDGVRAWNFIMSPAQILARYNSGRGLNDGVLPGLIAGANFNEGTGTTVSDLTGTRTFTLPAGVTWSDGAVQESTTRQVFEGKHSSYFRRFVSRNRNYKGRILRYYEGVYGQPEGDFVQKWHGSVENIVIKKGAVSIEAVDLLKKLGDTEIPPKVECKLVAEIDAGVQYITLTTLEKFPETDGYVRIDDEIIHYTTANQNTKQLENCTRGAFSTTAATHKVKTKVQVCRYYPPQNPWDLLLEMLRDGDALGRTWSANTIKARGDRVIPSTPTGWEYEVIGGTLNWRTGSTEPTWATPAGATVTDGDITYRCIDPAVDLSSFYYWKEFPGEDLNFTALISVPTKLDKLYFEVIGLLDAKSWVGEDLRITVRRNLPNTPTRTYTYLSDEANISFKSPSVDLNEKSRVTRVLVYWDKPHIEKDDDLTKYRRLDIAVDGEAESAAEYNEVIEKQYLCRWINSSDFQEEIVQRYVRNLATRQVWRMRDAAPILTFETDIKDGGIKTGDWVRITTDELLEWTGDRVVNADFQIIFREPKEKTVAFKALKMHNRKIGFIAPNTAPDWDAAESTDKEYAYISDTKGELDNLPGYFIW